MREQRADVERGARAVGGGQQPSAHRLGADDQRVDLGQLAGSKTSKRRLLARSLYDYTRYLLFPNQDAMPAGGFGNLIALLLQLFPLMGAAGLEPATSRV